MPSQPPPLSTTMERSCKKRNQHEKHATRSSGLADRRKHIRSRNSTAPEVAEARVHLRPRFQVEARHVGHRRRPFCQSRGRFVKNHDLQFSGRPVAHSLTSFGYDRAALGFTPYGPYWRAVRRIYSMEMSVNMRMRNSLAVRQRCIEKMIDWISEESEASRSQGGCGEVKLIEFLFPISFNLIGNMLFSRDLVNPKSKEGVDFLDAMNKVIVRAVKPNVADFFPFLKRVDPQGIKRNMARDMGICLEITTRFVMERIDERLVGKKNDDDNKDFLDALLDYEGNGKDGPQTLSRSCVNIIILENFFGGTETTSISIEWGMTELLRNPESMRRAREEMDRIVGQRRKVEGSDIDKLPYLQAVVKETLRLHPPFAMPLRCTVEDTELMGHHIPKDTQVFVNAWAIGRDPEAWEDPSSFKPERFLDSGVDLKGQHFELIPFGSGRRMCVGINFGQRVVVLAMASLLQCFDWEIGGGVASEDLNMDERVGITTRKLEPLKAIPKKRRILCE